MLFFLKDEVRSVKRLPIYNCFSLACLAIQITMKANFFVMMVLCVVLLTLQSAEMSPTERERRQMKAYFCVMLALCVVLLTLQSVEMSPATRERRQLDNIEEISRDFAGNLTRRILTFVEGILRITLG
ncbi:hypothetical protein NPIL_304101 [Nephila pilipes]|uniref:Uncharacterized protein n=1 Tax=Nephila pilipes TaxID=299642 RepID=A0A8X6TMI0_NEPPI|nr:hypothetical protein NPIL_304101 [Nephila pilipes]